MSAGDWSTVEDVVAGFDEHLRRTRGVCPGTRRYYARFVRAFLQAVFADGPAEVADICVRDVADFVGAATRRYQAGTVELAASSLRSFFRFLRAAGLRSDRLEDAVPMVPHRRAALGLGRTFQGVGLYEDLTVEENVVVGQHLATRRGPESVGAVLRSLGLSRLSVSRVGEISQGQRQLVSVARALAGEPRLLLLDEPAAGLDSTESLWLADRLRDVRDAGVTILLIDHDMSLVLGLCDEIHVLDFGELIASGNPGEIRDNRRVAQAYLGATHAKEALT